MPPIRIVGSVFMAGGLIALALAIWQLTLSKKIDFGDRKFPPIMRAIVLGSMFVGMSGIGYLLLFVAQPTQR